MITKANTSIDGTVAITDGVGSRLLPVPGGCFTSITSVHGWAGKLLARRLGLPTTRSGRTTGALDVQTVDGVEQWTRTFGARTWRSTVTAGPDDSLVERTGPIHLCFDIDLDDRWITHMTLRSVRVAKFPTPLARWIHVDARIGPGAETVVTMQVPGGRCSYTAEPMTEHTATDGVVR